MLILKQENCYPYCYYIVLMHRKKDCFHQISHIDILLSFTKQKQLFSTVKDWENIWASQACPYQVGPAGLGLWPSLVALLHRFRLGLFCPSEGVLMIFRRSQAGRPDLSRPACFSFGIRPNFSSILCSPSSFGFAA